MKLVIAADPFAVTLKDAFLNAQHTEGLDQFADFLKMAKDKVDSIDQGNLK